ncbi:hypothetical protein EFP84_05245 [Leptospira kmetyi]|uniref:Uncharacterized protein n=1 Tax=Leptospira kmetyi TaxID=408139 RepID=A0AAD0UNZ0_9LEPT|nr:hypothetical protein EFP84_05245 [Leptospira kmetyi]
MSSVNEDFVEVDGLPTHQNSRKNLMSSEKPAARPDHSTQFFRNKTKAAKKSPSPKRRRDFNSYPKQRIKFDET